MVQASCDGGGRTTPELPATSGTGPPVTEVTSDGASRKQGGTVEYFYPTPEYQGWGFFVPFPAH